LVVFAADEDHLVLGPGHIDQRLGNEDVVLQVFILILLRLHPIGPTELPCDLIGLANPKHSILDVDRTIILHSEDILTLAWQQYSIVVDVKRLTLVIGHQLSVFELELEMLTLVADQHMTGSIDVLDNLDHSKGGV
jgi:hypothetical protein